MGEDLLIFGVLTTGAVLIVGHVARLVRAGITHKTIREAISRDSPAVPTLLQDVEARPSGAGSDDRTGLVLVALALALFLYSAIQGDAEQVRAMGGAALFPGLVGLALIARFHYARRREAQP